MNGPRTAPTQLQPPGGANTQPPVPEAPQLPQPQPSGGGAQAPAAPGAPPALSPDEQALLSSLGGGQAPAGAPTGGAPAPGQPELTPEEQGLLASLAGGAGEARAPAAEGAQAPQAQGAPQGSSLFGMLAKGLIETINPLLSLTEGKKDAPSTAAALSEFAKHPQGKQQIFQKLAGDGFESRVVDDEVQFRRKGEGDDAWRNVKPGWFDSLHSFMQRTANFIPEVFEAGAQTAAVAVGTAEGAAGGAAAGSVVPGAGTVVGGVLGAVGGAAAAGAGSSLAAGLAREGVARLLGAETDPNLGMNMALQAGTGALLPAVGVLFRRPAKWAAEKAMERVLTSKVAQARDVGLVVKEFNNVYDSVVGGVKPTMGQAGSFVRSAVEGAESHLGEQIGVAWDHALRTHPDTVFPTPKFASALEETLKAEGFRFEAAPRLVPSDPLKYTAVAPPDLRATSDTPALFQRLAKLWNEQSSSGGMKVQELRETLSQIQTNANYSSLAPTDANQSWRALYSALRTDRDQILGQVTKGTEVEGIAKGAFAEYADNIDTLRGLSKAAEKSPEKFAANLLKDAETASVAKRVLANPDPSAIEGVTGWDAMKSAWLKSHFEATLDEKTGIVDIPKFWARINKNPDLAKVVLGEESMQAFKGLASRMERMNFEGLLKNPDGNTSGVLRAAVKAVVSGGQPAYAANLVGAMVSYSPEILTSIQKNGIVKFAEEAETLQARNNWMRIGKMIQRLQDATTIKVDVKGAKRAVIPVESSLIPVLLNAGVRPAAEAPDQQKAKLDEGFKAAQEHAVGR